MIQMPPIRALRTVGADMADPEDDNFLSRWSRRKRGEHPEQTLDEPIAQVEDAEETDEGDPEVIAQLPDIDGMDDSSDFTVFLKAGVPEALRRRALRKLWRVNPVLANLDGLNDYDEDYTQAAMAALGRGMKTLYQVGGGFATDESEVVADESEPPTDATDDPETRLPSELPPPDESEPQVDPQTDPVETALNRAEAPAPVEPAPKHKGAARSRRWGVPAKPS